MAPHTAWPLLLAAVALVALVAAWARAARRTARLRDTEERYRLMAENVEDVISVLDLDHRLLYVSPSVTRLRGYTVAEALAQPVTERVCPGSLPLIRRTMAAAVAAEAAGGPPVEHVIDVEIPCKDGSTVWVELKASFLRDAAGRPTSILSVARDITKRRRAEARRVALAEASDLLTRSLDPDEIARVLATTACRLLAAESAATYTMERAEPEPLLAAVAPDRGAAWPARLPRDGHPGVLQLPLVARERRLGVLAVRAAAGAAFDDDDVTVARTFAAQAAVVLENAALHQATEQQLRHSETLLAVSQALSSSLDVNEAFRRTTRAITRALRADTGGTWRLDANASQLIPLAGYRVPEALAKSQAPVVLPLTHVLVRELAQTHAPAWSPDSWGDERLRDLPWLDAIQHKSVLALPLRGAEGILGVVIVAWTRRHHALTEDERELVQSIGRQIAIGVDNVRLVEELRSRQGRLEAMLEVNRQLSTIQPVDSLLERIAEGCARVFDTTAAGFRLVEGDDLVLAGSWGETGRLMPAPRLPIATSVSGQIVRTGQPVVVADVAREPRFNGPARRAALANGYRSWLGVPVRIGTRVIGVLTVWSRRERSVEPEELATAEAFAAQAATALENARLYQEVSGAYEKLSRTQAQLVQSQKMEAVGRLAGGIAHDFNNLLTIVSGRAQILKVKLTDDDPLQRHVELIKKTVERTAGVTRQLLAFSRHQVLNPQTVDLSVLVENMGSMLRALIGEDVELTTALAPGLGAVHVDPGQMEQVVLNLAVNARDAMARGGRLTLATSDLTTAAPLAAAAGELPAGEWTVLSVSDAGSGMAPDTLSHIFEPFFTTKPTGQGTGLGLATVYGIVKQSGGHVLVDSVQGEGTTFRIALPRVPATASEADEVEDGRLPMPGGSETILLVEDEDDVRELEQELLTGLGYRVLTAVNGADAVAVCQRHRGPIDLMVSDVIMPVMSGPEAAAQVQALRPGLKVLFVSGYTDGAIAPHGDFELGVNLLLKPFDPTALARAVRERLSHEALVTA